MYSLYRVVNTCFLLLAVVTCMAQPFETLLSYRLHYHVPTLYDDIEKAGAEKFTLLQHTADVLIPIPTHGRFIIISGAFVNHYKFSATLNGETLESRSYVRLTFKGGVSYQWANDRHTTLAIALPTWAGDDRLMDRNAFQIGGLLVHSILINDRLTIKAGLYYNLEQFGNFFMPLAGVDWRLNNGWYIFGLLPGTFNVYKKVNDWFAFSLSERAPNGSLLDILNSGDYVRFGRSPYVVFTVDAHFTPYHFQLMGIASDLTFSISVGHTVYRTYELYEFSGASGDTRITDGLFADVRSSPYVRLSVALRAWN